MAKTKVRQKVKLKAIWFNHYQALLSKSDKKQIWKNKIIKNIKISQFLKTFIFFQNFLWIINTLRMHSTVHSSKEHWILPWFSQNRSANLKKCCENISSKKKIFCTIKTDLLCSFQKSSFRNCHKYIFDKNGFQAHILRYNS